jgi:hypothetical protein
MGRIRDWFYNRRLTRLERDLKVLNQRLIFNPYKAVKLDSEIDSSVKLTERIEEYRVWYVGNERMLRELYARHIKPSNVNYFWHKALNEYVKLHSGIPGLISRKMAQVVFGAGFKQTVTYYGDEEKSAVVQELLDGLIDACDIKTKLALGAETESWSGNVFFKLSHDAELSSFPIVELCDIRNAEAIKERGITKAIIFKYYYEQGKYKYRLDEIYTTNENGDATIIYELYVMKPDGSDDRVPIATVNKLRELSERLGEDNDRITYVGLKGMLALEKPNKLPSHEFMDLGIGASDYEGAIGSFDALDEVYSEMISEVRNNKTIRYFPQEMLPTTTTLDGKLQVIKPNPFITNYQEIRIGGEEGAKKEVTTTQISDKQDSLRGKFNTALTTAINQAGLSPFALGITGLEGINASAESQQERNKVTLETRGAKQQLWAVFMEKLFIKMLELNSWLRNELKVEQPFDVPDDLSYDNLDINIEFSPYIYPRSEDLLTTWGSAKMQRVASTREAITNIHPNWSKAQIEEEVNLIRYEEGMSLDTPELMQFEDVLEPKNE